MTAHNPIPLYIREIDELTLTKWGQIKLTGFPEAAIVHARKALRLSKMARNPYGLFFNAALEYCKANNLHISWTVVDTMKEAYKMPENAPMLLVTKESGKKSSTKQVQDSDSFFEKLAVRIQEVSQEDPYAAALKIERHYETENGKKFVQHCGKVNPWMEKLQKDDQLRIVVTVTNERNI